MFTQSISRCRAFNVIYYFLHFYLRNVVRGTCYGNASVRLYVTPGIVSKRVNLS